MGRGQVQSLQKSSVTEIHLYFLFNILWCFWLAQLFFMSTKWSIWSIIWLYICISQWLLNLLLPLSQRFKFQRKIIPFRSHKFILSLHSANSWKQVALLASSFLLLLHFIRLAFDMWSLNLINCFSNEMLSLFLLFWYIVPCHAWISSV